jgi:hypothetical protein
MIEGKGKLALMSTHGKLSKFQQLCRHCVYGQSNPFVMREQKARFIHLMHVAMHPGVDAVTDDIPCC